MKERNFAYDFIRAFAIFLVVCIHSQGKLRDAVVLEENPQGIQHWCQAFWHIIYVGVPLFVMLSGALLLGKQESLKIFFKKRFTRILIPFAVWSVIMGLLLFYKEHHNFSGSLRWIVESTMTKGVIGIYWYIYLIVGLYLITPLLRMIIAQAGKKAAIYLVILIFAIVFINQFFPSVSLAGRFTCANLLWIGYYVLGYLIVNTEVDLKENNRRLLMLMGVIVVYVLGVGDMLVIGSESVFHPLITIIEAALMFFILSKCYYNYLKENKILGGGILQISEVSYGMYLTHFLFISLLLSVSFIKHTPLTIEPLMLAVSTFIVDVALMAILKKIGLKKWVM